MTAANQEIRAYYLALYGAWGRRRWSTARTRFEVIVGASVPARKASWKNVEIALHHFITLASLVFAAIRTIPLNELEALIQPAGYFRPRPLG